MYFHKHSMHIVLAQCGVLTNLYIRSIKGISIHTFCRHACTDSLTLFAGWRKAIALSISPMNLLSNYEVFWGQFRPFHAITRVLLLESSGRKRAGNRYTFKGIINTFSLPPGLVFVLKKGFHGWILIDVDFFSTKKLDPYDWPLLIS